MVLTYPSCYLRQFLHQHLRSLDDQLHVDSWSKALDQFPQEVCTKECAYKTKRREERPTAETQRAPHLWNIENNILAGTDRNRNYRRSSHPMKLSYKDLSCSDYKVWVHLTLLFDSTSSCLLRTHPTKSRSMEIDRDACTCVRASVFEGFDILDFRVVLLRVSKIESDNGSAVESEWHDRILRTTMRSLQRHNSSPQWRNLVHSQASNSLQVSGNRLECPRRRE